MVKYVLMDYDAYGSADVYAIYSSRADAEEMFFTFCEDWVYETMMCGDPLDIFGKEEWDWKEDYDYLMRDCARTLTIAEVSYYV